jgi:hypothetical protein
MPTLQRPRRLHYHKWNHRPRRDVQLPTRVVEQSSHSTFDFRASTPAFGFDQRSFHL